MSSGTADALGLSRAILCNGESPSHQAPRKRGIVAAHQAIVGPALASTPGAGPPAPEERPPWSGEDAQAQLPRGDSKWGGASSRSRAGQLVPLPLPSCPHRTRAQPPSPACSSTPTAPTLPSLPCLLQEVALLPCLSGRAGPARAGGGCLEGEHHVRTHSHPHACAHTPPRRPARHLDLFLPSSACVHKQPQLRWPWDINTDRNGGLSWAHWPHWLGVGVRSELVPRGVQTWRLLFPASRV